MEEMSMSMVTSEINLRWMGTSIYLSEKFDTEDYLKNMRDKSFSYQMKKYKSCVTASDYAMLCKLVLAEYIRNFSPHKYKI